MVSQSADMQHIGMRYDVLGTIGHGAAAVVYEVRDRWDGTTKALKLLHPQSVASDEVVRRFEEEFRVLRGLHHPSLLEVFDYGWADDDSRYMVMELVEGRPLDQYLADHPQDLWVILYELCEVLTFIHSHSLLHLDIKPANILIKRSAAFGEEIPLVVLIDFGLIHRRGAGDNAGMVGTPEYMAPEVIRGETPFTNAVDYYSLGVTLYQLITGDLPFRGNARDVFAGHLHREPRFEREKIEYAELYPHIRGLMSKDKRKRLESFEDFKRAVTARMTGGIQELEKSYGLARINSLGMIGKDEVWKELMEWVERDVLSEDGKGARVISVVGAPGSGKSYMLNTVASELSIRGGLTFWCGRRESHLLAGTILRAEDHDGAWQCLAESAKDRGAAVLAVDDVDEMSEAECELVSYLERRSRLEVSGASRIKFVVTRSSARQDAPGPDWKGTYDIEIRPLQPTDHDVVLSAFRHMVARQDGEDLRLSLRGFGHNMEAVRSGLVEAAMEGALSFVRGKWHFESAGFRPSGESGAHHARIVAGLSEDDRAIISVAACSIAPLDSKTASHVTGMEVKRAGSALQRLTRAGLFREVTRGDTTEFVFPSERIRERVHDVVPQNVRTRAHQQFRVLMELKFSTRRKLPSEIARIQEQLAFHLGELAEYRQATRQALRSLDYYVRSGERESMGLVVSRAIQLCRRWALGGDAKDRADLILRYLVKVVVEDEWRRGNLHRVKRIIDQEYRNRGIPVPTSFIPKYARALQAAGLVAQAEDLLRATIATVPFESIPNLQLRVELGLVQEQSSAFAEALATLDSVRPHMEKLDDYYRCRVYIHYCICYDAMSVSDKALEMGDAAEQIAQARAFIYEQAIVYQVRANVLFSRQELARAMSTISRGVRFCGRHGQFKSLGRFYFLASAIYYSGGDYRRCLTYLQKSTQVAERLGDEFLACGNVIRFAMIHHGLGEYGNALRYLDRAENMLENTGRDEEVVLVSLARLDICLDLGMDEADRLVAELRGVGDEIRLNRRGYYHFLLGRRYEAAGDNALARTNYDVARELFIRGDIADDTFMATAALARLSCRMGDEDSCDAHLAYLEKEAPNVESDNVRALFGLAKLEHATRHVRDDRSLYVVAESSEVDRRTITEVYTQLIIDAVLFRAWRRLGEREKSLEAFRRFHASVKKVLANLSDRSLASCFLAQPAISEPLREFKEFQGEK